METVPCKIRPVGMASHHRILDDSDQDTLECALTTRVRSRAREVTELLPGALLLLGYHALVIRSGGPSQLPVVVQIVFGASVLCATVSVLMLAFLIGARTERHVRSQRRLLQVNVLAAAGMTALAAALAGDFFVTV